MECVNRTTKSSRLTSPDCPGHIPISPGMLCSQFLWRAGTVLAQGRPACTWGCMLHASSSNSSSSLAATASRIESSYRTSSSAAPARSHAAVHAGSHRHVCSTSHSACPGSSSGTSSQDASQSSQAFLRHWDSVLDAYQDGIAVAGPSGAGSRQQQARRQLEQLLRVFGPQARVCVHARMVGWCVQLRESMGMTARWRAWSLGWDCHVLGKRAVLTTELCQIWMHGERAWLFLCGHVYVYVCVCV